MRPGQPALVGEFVDGLPVHTEEPSHLGDGEDIGKLVGVSAHTQKAPRTRGGVAGFVEGSGRVERPEAYAGIGVTAGPVGVLSMEARSRSDSFGPRMWTVTHS